MNETANFAPKNSPLNEHATWRCDLVWLTVILGVWFTVFLGVRPLSNPDEGRYAEIPREMAASNDYVTPRLNGVKYFEKPPLVYWLTALAIEVGGVNEWTARLWIGLFAVIGGLVTYATARALYGRAAGWWAAVVLCTSLLYYGLSRIVILDLPVAVLMSAALFAFLIGVRTPPGAKRRWLFWAFYASMALAVLAKGLIGFVLPCTVAFVWLLVFNQWRYLRPCHPITGAILLLAIAAPWHVMAQIANHSPVKEHDFLWFYFVHEHYLRFTTTIHSRVQPWWFFGPVIIAGLVPWLAFAWQSLRANLRGACAWRTRTEPKNADVWFFLTWIIVITLFFSKSQSKLIPYILPIFPAIAVLMGRYLADVLAALRKIKNGEATPMDTTGLRVGLRIAALLALIFAAAFAVYPVPPKTGVSPEMLLPWRIWLAVVMGGGGVLIAAFSFRRRERAALITVAACFGILQLTANFIVGPFDNRSSKDLDLVLKEQLAKTPDADVYSVGDYFQDMPVYLNRLVTLVEGIGELEYGVSVEHEKMAPRFIDRAEFSRRWSNGARAYAIVQKRNADEYFPAGQPRYIVAESTRYLLLVNELATK